MDDHKPTTWIWSLVRFATCALLFIAAALKGGSGSTNLIVGGSFPLLGSQVAVIAAEVILGAWLLSGLLPASSWLTAFATFCTLLLVRARSAWIGHTTCGCFGSVEVHPLWAVTVNLVILAGLALSRPRVEQLRAELTRVGPSAAFWGGGSAMAFVLILGVGSWFFGSPSAALAWLRGDVITVAPWLVYLGTEQPGELKTVEIVVNNWADRPIRLIGGTHDCSCTVTDELPVVIPAKSSRTIPVRVIFPPGRGEFTREVGLRTDQGGSVMVSFRVSGIVGPG